MNATATRQELHGFIDALPERSFGEVKMFLSALSAEPATSKEGRFVIETDLTEAEKKIITDGRRERLEHPENFISLDDYLKTRGIDKRTLTGRGGAYKD